MSASIIDGKAIAQNLRDSIRQKVSTMKAAPGLAVILVGTDPASQVYVRNKIKATQEAGMRSLEYVMPEHATQDEIALMIDTLNNDDNVQGILLQLPLPKHLNSDPLIQRIMGHAVQLPEPIWMRLNLAWVLFFVVCGCIQLFVAFTFERFWVDFKVFGSLGMTLLFLIGQGVFLARHMHDAPTGEKPKD